MKIIILAGGQGTRLWPMSRKNFPKQFLKIKNKTLFQETVNRCLLLEKEENIFISTTKDYARLVKEELKGTNINIIIEPFSRNTGPAILYVLNNLKAKDHELILVCPSDHFIAPENEFVKTIEKAKKSARNNQIITFGIKPLSPETGYGYIETKDSLKNKDGSFKVLNFIEKPDLKKAQALLSKGNYYWNSGIFLFPYKLMLHEFETHAKDLIKEKTSISIDKAVIEKSSKIATIKANFNWSDVGSWNSFYKIQKKDKNNNVILGNAIIHDTKDSLILGKSRLIACLGLKDVAVIETSDAVLVTPKNRSEEVKQLVHNLELETIRPWGSYEILKQEKGSKIKKIIVSPKKRLSLQSHNHRAEHWIVIKGKAKVTLNENEYFLKKGEYFFIPKKAKHRLENQETYPLEIIEVQEGDYLEEDDIIRYEDDFNRIK